MGKGLRILMVVLLLTACSVAPDNSADMSGYENMGNTESVFYEMDVKTITERMDNGETFAVFFGFEKCPWCNLLVPELSTVAKSEECQVGYVDTRLKPEWQSNIDIDDYDLFVERFGDYLEEDEDGIPHLYVPDVYFIKEGQVLGRYILPEEVDTEGLTEEQKEEVQKELTKLFKELKE